MSVQSKLFRLSQSPQFRSRLVQSGVLLVAIYVGHGAIQKYRSVGKTHINDQTSTKETKTKRMSTINRRFIQHLIQLLKIMIPSIFSREATIIIIHSITLIARTFLSIYVAALEGRIVKAIVRKDSTKFLLHMGRWLAIALPATFVNSMIRFFVSWLGLAFRQKLTQHSYQLYFNDQTFYRVSSLDGRLSNADQNLTEDITMFSQSVAHLYSHLTKPILDVVLIGITLYRYSQKRGSAGQYYFVPALMAGTVITATARILKCISPRFGQMVEEEAKRKGQLRYLHSRVITNCEEIAFYGGHVAEQKQLSTAFQALKSQMSLIYQKRIFYIMMEQFLMKYVWSGTGMIMIAMPILTAQYANSDQTNRLDDEPDGGVSERTRAFATAKNLLYSAADAVERLITSYKEITELAGYTSRVWEMLRVFEDVKNGEYMRTSISGGRETESGRGQRFDTSKIEGIQYESINHIRLQKVPIVTPTGDVVVRSMSIQIPLGMHLLITGPNGCGKSSLFRILGGLWPIYRGIVECPPKSAMYYIPQRPYMTLGTLRDQVIYPDTQSKMEQKGINDEQLINILNIVHLSHIVEREGGWNARNDWMDVLSGGEKQRMGLARVFYHQPLFALLDECTSAVSIDVEGDIYQAAKDHEITLLTVTHRPSLWKFHTHLLQFDGEGGWKLESLESSMSRRLSMAEEKKQLQQQLAEIPSVQDRMQQLCAILGEDEDC